MIGYTHPDWILLGTRINNQCAVFASTHLGLAELEQVRDEFRMFHFSGRIIEEPPKFKLSAEMDQFKMAYGETYAEAIAKVMGTWDPDEKTGLPAGSPALTPSTKEEKTSHE